MMKTHFLVLWLMVLISDCLGDYESNVTPCTVKKWKIRVEKPLFQTPSGRFLQCKGDVVVRGCRGLCESFERGTYQPPYLYRHHVQCTYHRITYRDVELSECDEGYPQRTYRVFEAAECGCRRCTSGNSNCVGLING